MAGYDADVFGGQTPAAAGFDEDVFPKASSLSRSTYGGTRSAPTNRGLELLSNIPGSASQLVSNMVQAILHPVDTVSGVMDAAAGGLRALTPAQLRSALDRFDAPETTQRISNTAAAVGKHYGDRYGSIDALTKTAVDDPVGVAADLSTFLGGAGLLANTARMPSVGGALSAASKYTNPLSVVTPVGKAVGKTSANLLGSPMFTGLGPESVTQAFKAGAKGGTSYLDNLQNRVPFTDVLDDARAGLAKMKADKSAEYTANMAGVRSDATVLKFDGIDNALGDAAKGVTFKGVVKNEKAAAALSKVADDVNSWKSMNPRDFHTPEGLDALKQKIGATLESLPFEDKSARLAVGKVYHAVKDEIVKQAPTYAKTMKAYEEASDLVKEIERALSLKETAAADTAMRKLQSLMRNNVNTNYGNRLNLATELVDRGGRDIMPALAGQAASSWTPRGLGWLGGTGLTAGSALALHNPAILAGLPLQSPKLVGLGAYGLGATGRNLLDMGITPARARNAGLLGAQASGLLQDGDNAWNY